MVLSRGLGLRRRAAGDGKTRGNYRCGAELVVDAQQASVSMLQRRFRIGYNRAARIIDAMEERQIVGPADGSRPRQVLISEEDLENMKDAEEDGDMK